MFDVSGRGSCAQELPEPIGFGVAEEFVGRALFFDLALMKEDHVLADIGGKPHVVGDDDHRPALFREVLDHLHDLLFQFGVERRGRFVKQKCAGFHAKPPGDGGPLLLAPDSMAG